MKTEMTNRERVLAALHSKEVDRLPWAPLIDPYFINSLPLQNYKFDILQAMRFIGNDIIERHVFNPAAIVKNVTERREEKADGAYRTYFETPVGSLYEERKSSGETSYICKHMVESLEDIRVFQYICEQTSYEPQPKAFAARDREIGDDGIATPSGNMSPVQELLQSVSGVENTVYLMADYPDEMEELFHVMHERNKLQYRALMEYPCDVIIDYEDTSTTVMNRRMFKDCSLPAINDYADLCHAGGKLFITHMCGKLTGFSEMIGSGRQDGVDSVCPPETGDLCPWDAREAWGPGKVLIGGIDPPSLVSMTREETLQTVAEVIRRVKNKTGFILSTGDAVPFGTPIENLRCVTALLKRLGGQSLSCEVPPEILSEI